MTIKKILRILRPGSIRSQLIFGIAFTNVLLMSLFVVELMNRQKAVFLKLNHDRAVGLSINLANTSNSFVISYELGRLKKLVSTYKDIPNLEYAMVTTADGLVLAHTDGKYIGLKATDSISSKLKPVNATQILLEDSNILDIVTPIINHEEIAGWARVGVSQKYIQPYITEIQRRGLFYMLISFIAGVVIALIVAGRLSEGLQKLVNAAQKIKEGERDLRVYPSKSIEVTQLGIAINQMLDDISSNEKLLNMVLETMPVGVFILDAKGKVLSLNPAAQQIWEGAKYAEDAGGYSVYKGWFPDGKKIESHEWGAAIALTENKAVLNQEAEIEGFNGTRKTILNSCIPMHDVNEKITGIIAINVDITARKLAEIELIESENRFRRAFEDSAIGMGLTSIKEQALGRWLKVNRSLCDMLGYTENELLSLTFMQITHPDDLARDIAAQTRILQGESDTYRLEKRYIHKNGNFVWINLNVSIVRNKDKDPMYLVAQVENITDKIESQIKFQNLVENFVVGVYILQNNNFAYVNPRVLEETGYTEEDILGMPFDQFIYPEDLQKVRDIIKLRTNGLDATRYETRILRKDGKPIWYEILGGSTSYKGAPALIGTMVNITDRKAMYEELIWSEANMRSIFDTTNVSYLLLDTNYTIIALNQEMKNIYSDVAGIDMKENDNLFDLLPPEKREETKAIYDTVVQTNKSRDYETTYEKEGSSRHFLANVKPITNGQDVMGICITAIDITQRKEAEREKASTLERLILSENQIRNFARHLNSTIEEERARIAREIHDEFGQQLAGIKIGLSVFKKVKTDDNLISDKANEMVMEIDNSIQTMRKIATALRPGILDSLGLIPSIRWLCSEFEKKTSTKCEFDTNTNQEKFDHDISTCYFRICQEAFTNITKHAEASKVRVEINQKKNDLEMRITDNGKGMASEKLQNPFSMGLLGMRERAKTVGALLTITSEKNKGTLILLTAKLTDNE